MWRSLGDLYAFIYFRFEIYPPASFIRSSPHAIWFLLKLDVKRQSILPDASQAKLRAEEPNYLITHEFCEAKLLIIEK